ncbi:MAG: class I SAM-dependent methyltransferase [Anaerolineaceae bacterium]|nr:class I SAM-dependent methyltransferase [Anaerolineaceae bacterium]
MDDKAKSRQYFNGHSSTGINRNGYWSHDYKATTAVLLDHKVTNHIDIGCGNGAFLAYLHAAAPEITIHGLDYSAEMVSRSRERLSCADIVEGDAEKMPLPDEAFDGVSCHMSIHHYPHPEKALIVFRSIQLRM